MQLLLAGDISTNPGPTPITLNIACANVQSLSNKFPSIELFVNKHQIDCLLLTETWLQPIDQEPSTTGDDTRHVLPSVWNAYFVPDGFSFSNS